MISEKDKNTDTFVRELESSLEEQTVCHTVLTNIQTFKAEGGGWTTESYYISCPTSSLHVHAIHTTPSLLLFC
jgi:hypothetical protein